MSRSRWFLLVGFVVAGVLTATVGWLLTRPTADEETAGSGGATHPSSQGDTQIARASRAVAERGVTEVRVTVKANMPPEFDEGVPSRRFKGEGTVDFAADIAAVDYDVADVPNTLGYLGHVEEGLSVVYQGSAFLVTAPVIADLLPGDLDWMSYQITDFSDPNVLGRGIGQLREIGLADPRIGFALASSGVGGEPSDDGTLSIDLAEAGATVGAAVQPTILELQALGAQEMLFGTEVDEEGLLRSYSYELTYPPAGPGGAETELSVTVDITEAADDEAVEVPPEAAVQPYLEYLGL